MEGTLPGEMGIKGSVKRVAQKAFALHRIFAADGLGFGVVGNGWTHL
jgi:hypothetical protein